MTARPNLRVIPDEPEPQPEEALAKLVPELMAAEAKVARLRNALDVQRRRLATKRGVAFIRPEHVRREFAR